jgi:4-amino-4-deoxy-L-arabinose transferase-like glycosyltransferase
MVTDKTGGAVPAPPDPPAFLLRLRLLLILFALTVSLPGLFSLPAGDRDESRFAQATKQMTESGDYLRIMNGAEPRNKKPIGIYWLQAPEVLVAGHNLQNPIWPYRLPSVLGGLAATLAVFEIGLLLTGSAAIGALAAAMLAGSLILATESHIAKTDAALLGASIARWQQAVFWLAAAVGILLKGPITPMVIGLTTLTLCLWERRTRWLGALAPLWGVPLMLAAILPWFIAIGIATHGAFFAQAVGGDLGRKLAGGAEAHGGLPGLHLLLLPLLAFPSTLPVLASLPGAWTDRRERTTRFLLAWIIPSWLVFEAVPTKLPHYTLPLYPALFLLAARFVLGPRTLPPRWMLVTGRAALLAASALIGVAALALPIVLHASWWLGVPAAFACCLGFWWSWRRHPIWALAAAPLLYAAVFYGELPRIPALWIAPRIEAILKTGWPAWNAHGQGVVVAGYAEPSLMFAVGTNIRLLANGALAADGLAAVPDGAAVIGDRDQGAFDTQALHLGLTLHKLGEVRGFNYSRGRWITLSLYTK